MSCIPNSPVQNAMLGALKLVESAPTGPGCAILTALYAVAIVFMLPGTPLNLAAGFLYNFWLGSFVSVGGCTGGAMLACLLGRTLLRKWAEEKAASYTYFHAIDRAISDKGFLLISLLRLSPIMPFGVCCYLLGITKVSFTTYSLATFVGLLPGTLAYTYLGTLLKDLSQVWSAEGGRTKTLITVTIIIVTTVLLIVIIAWITKRALSKVLAESQVKAPYSTMEDPIELGTIEEGTAHSGVEVCISTNNHLGTPTGITESPSTTIERRDPKLHSPPIF
ncbi:SNARE associated Golgi protein [Pelomyxa schiedti]|nr:SNARE associated Golgi protein [Pelomyxa schiedti]